jgi:hypothetical protein
MKGKLAYLFLGKGVGCRCIGAVLLKVYVCNFYDSQSKTTDVL